MYDYSDKTLSKKRKAYTKDPKGYWIVTFTKLILQKVS